MCSNELSPACGAGGSSWFCYSPIRCYRHSLIRCRLRSRAHVINLHNTWGFALPRCLVRTHGEHTFGDMVDTLALPNRIPLPDRRVPVPGGVGGGERPHSDSNFAY